ncbi:VOC family protein [Sphingomonas sinipercae]|uniref:VOC family protein n=1 Tax=Sphingomonas sinipercae TaxID=2714944 RepID=A0A6G7ZL67_9SPHN|nr:VOC family protein [Sphingomonas sinipercae]QIL01721.1 VOC family protein [Sphingomonas sinipercae]
MTNPHGSFIWYELMTSDAKAAGDFYGAVVGGWTFGEPMPGPVDYRAIQRSDGGNAGGVLQLDDSMRSKGARPAWLGYIGVDDLDAEVAAVERDGGKTMMPPWDVPGIGRLAMVADPQGAPFYLMKPTPPPGQEGKSSDVFSYDQAEHVRWNELATTDCDGAVDFYTRHYGWRQEGDMDMGEMGKYRFIHQGGGMIGAIMRKPPQMPASSWSFYIGVDDIDRAATAVKAGSGQVLMGPHQIPGGEYSLNGIDPQGASFGLVGPRRQGENK